MNQKFAGSTAPSFSYNVCVINQPCSAATIIDKLPTGYMQTISIDNTAGKPTAKKIKTILAIGLLVGSLDILSAFADYSIATGRNPTRVLKYIASGIFGKKALTDGASMIATGLLFHFIIAFSFTIFFFWIYPKINILSKNRILTGIAYGIFIWTVMNLLVLPLSNVPPLTFKLGRIVKAVLILIVMIGLPLSFIAYNYFHKKSTETGS